MFIEPTGYRVRALGPSLTAGPEAAKVTGLDLTPELIEQARENAAIARMPGIVWTLGDAEDLPYPDASFDVVVTVTGSSLPQTTSLTVSRK